MFKIDRRKKNTAMKLVFLIYCIVMLWLLFGRVQIEVRGSYWEQLGRNINLKPFYTILAFARQLGREQNASGLSVPVINLYGNVIVFIPCGFFLPCLWKKLRTFGWCLFYFSIALIGVEIIQLFTLRGICDIDDLILNVIGVAAGFGLWRVLLKIWVKIQF